MPNIKSAKKSLRQDIKKHKSNLRTKGKMKKIIKGLNEFAEKLEKSAGKIAENDAKKIQECLTAAYKNIDKAVKKGVIKKNTASRKKSKLAKKVNALRKNEKQK